MPSKHTIPLSDGWRLWRCAPLRGTGFPTKSILRLAAERAAKAAQTLIQAEVAKDAACNAALTAVRERSRAGDIDRAIARKAIGKLRKGAAYANTEALGSAKEAADAAAEAIDAYNAAVLEYHETYESDSEEVAKALATSANDPRFEEAMLWQNPEATKLVLNKVRDLGHKRNRGLRQAQGLVANYLQRYCVKNDTIGFFGPVAWATLSEDDGISLSPGESLLKRRTVYFEHWALLKLAEHITELSGVREHLAPRTLPTVRVSEDGVVHYGVGKSTKVPPSVAAILKRANGTDSATQLAVSLCEEAESEFDSPDDVFSLLEELADMGLISWALELPSGGPNAAGALRTRLEKFPEGGARTSALEAFDELEEARRRVENCAGQPAELREALDHVAAVFSARVGQPATRNAGQMYAGRTVVYEDCLRDVQASFGRPFVEALAPALHLMAVSARWFSYEVASAYRTLADQVFAELSPEATEVDYVAFWKQLAPAFPESSYDASSIAKEVQARLVAKWSTIFGLSENSRDSIELTSGEIREAVLKAFDAPSPGWPSARHVSPDIMLAATQDDLAKGKVRGVLGEIHLGNSVPSNVRLQQYDRPDDIFEWNHSDLGTPIVYPVQPSELVTRADQVSWCPHDLSLEVGRTRSWRPASNVLRAAELVVRRIGERLRVETRDGSYSADIIEFLDPYLAFATISNFSWAPSQSRIPRVAIDNLVVLRQQWKYDAPQEIPFVSHNEGEEQFLACQRWARSEGLPRWVFFKVPEETKPVYLDFDSPILVARARNLLGKASRVTFSEMSPSFDALWLEDHQKNTYASELRIVAVDPIRWDADSRLSQDS